MQAPISSATAAPELSADAEHQLDLVRSAIALLAAGGARRVTLVNLTLSEASRREANGLARANGMRMVIKARGIGSDVTVEASG